MDAFNYLSVLVSIILGLGITQLLASVGRAVEQRGTRIPYWPPAVWALVLLLAHVQTWWSFYGLRTHESWSFLQFLFVLLQPIGLYLLSVLVLPGDASAAKDLKTRYHSNRSVFFGLLAAFLGLSIVRDLVVSGSLPEPMNAAFQVFLLVLSVVAACISNERFHKLWALTALGVFVAYIYILFSQLGA